MFKFHSIVEESVTIFDTTDQLVLHGKISFESAGEEVQFNVVLRLSEELVDLGATLPEAMHRFQGCEAFPFAIHVPVTDAVLEARAIHGSVHVWDLDRDEEIDEIVVAVSQIEPLNTIFCDSPWVADHGGSSFVLAGVQLTHGRHPTLKAYPGFPRSAKLVRFGSSPSSALPQLKTLADYLQEYGSLGSDAILIEELKLRLHQTKGGPRAAYPYTGAELNAYFLAQGLKRGVHVVGGVPRDLYATVPTHYTPQQIRHYQETLKQSFELVGIPVPRMQFLDESTAGGIGTIRRFWKKSTLMQPGSFSQTVKAFFGTSRSILGQPVPTFRWSPCGSRTGTTAYLPTLSWRPLWGCPSEAWVLRAWSC